MFKENPDFYPMKPLDYGRFLVISIGTGTQKNDNKYNARRAAKWGIFGWLYDMGSAPLVSVFSDAISDMVDYHLSVVFQILRSQENYLRIQVSLISMLAPADSTYLCTLRTHSQLTLGTYVRGPRIYAATACRIMRTWTSYPT